MTRQRRIVFYYDLLCPRSASVRIENFIICESVLSLCMIYLVKFYFPAFTRLMSGGFLRPLALRYQCTLGERAGQPDFRHRYVCHLSWAPRMGFLDSSFGWSNFTTQFYQASKRPIPIFGAAKE